MYNHSSIWKNITMIIFCLFILLLILILTIKLNLNILLNIIGTQSKIKLEFLFFKFERNGKFVLKNKKGIKSKKSSKNKKNKASKNILLKILKQGKYEKLYIYEEVGALEPFATAIVTAVASSITALPLQLLNINYNNFQYKVVPIYLDLKFNLNIDAKISFRIIDIVFSIIEDFLHKLYKKEVNKK